MKGGDPLLEEAPLGLLKSADLYFRPSLSPLSGHSSGLNERGPLFRLELPGVENLDFLPDSTPSS